METFRKEGCFGAANTDKESCQITTIFEPEILIFEKETPRGATLETRNFAR